jgi:hypothetical protein
MATATAGERVVVAAEETVTTTTTTTSNGGGSTVTTTTTTTHASTSRFGRLWGWGGGGEEAAAAATGAAAVEEEETVTEEHEEVVTSSVERRTSLRKEDTAGSKRRTLSFLGPTASGIPAPLGLPSETHKEVFAELKGRVEKEAAEDNVAPFNSDDYLNRVLVARNLDVDAAFKMWQVRARCSCGCGGLVRLIICSLEEPRAGGRVDRLTDRFIRQTDR